MERQQLDCRGLACPQPVLRTKEALEAGAEVLEVLVDNEAACKNVQRFAGSMGCSVHMEQEGENLHRLIITAQAGATRRGTAHGTAPEPDSRHCAPPAQGGLLYVLASDTMGRGDDQLGRSLMQTYVQTISQVDPLPETIILYNSGVRLVTAESGALEALRALQAKGVEILVCGTCLDFYQLQSALQVGQISNMFAIMNATVRAAKVVSPL